MDMGIFEEEMALKGFIVAVLVRQAMEDGKIGVAEKSYLSYALKTLQLEQNDIKAIIESPLDYSVHPPLEEDKRMIILYHLLFMLKTKKTIDFRKEELCYNIGFELGFRHEMIRDLICVIKEYKMNDLPPLALLDKIKPYLN